MKLLKIVIKPELQDEAKDLLNHCDVKGVMISNVMGFGNQRGVEKSYRGTRYTVRYLPKVLIETIVEDDEAQHIIDTFVEKLPTDEIGGGKIFVLPVEEAVRLRTGQTGEQAL